ncbi:MAG: peroxiredoxin [Nitrospirota bacterium]|nr:MAG: peroxiredoxin [Nitrospirota bacterium]
MINRFSFLVLISTVAVCMTTSVFGDSAADAKNRNESPHQQKVEKGTLEKKKGPKGPRWDRPALYPEEFRTIDGSGNNFHNPSWGSAPVELLRLTTVGYSDWEKDPSGQNRPNVRDISNIVASQKEKDISYHKRKKYSDFVWQWGQFLDHDLDLTPVVEGEPFDIAVPSGDKYFDPEGTGKQTIPLDRSAYTVVDRVRQQVNNITAFIDASNVYGSDYERAMALRMLDGSGRLKFQETSKGDLPPLNVNGLPNAAPGDPEDFFLCGDFRCNEQVALTAMHTLFVREHNRWAEYFSSDTSLTGDEIYERARAMVIGIMQHITYDEFLPLLIGKQALSSYQGYQSDVNPGISNVFATSAYRFGHSMVSSKLRLVNKNGKLMGGLPLREAFFNPAWISTNGIEDLLRGLASQVAQRYDVYMIDDLRNFLFGPPGNGGHDLASLNLQRGRDHGLPSYNQIRKDFGLSPIQTFEEISSNSIVRKRLEAAYGSVDDMDGWVAFLAEDPMPGAVVGQTVLTVLKDQFERVRDGDRFWYETYLPPDLVEKVKEQTLAKVIRRNTGIENGIQDNVFLIP